jgi:hypothetical protein
MATVVIGNTAVTITSTGTVSTAKTKVKASKDVLTETAKAQKFKIHCTGLKPLTRHFFSFGGTDFTAACKQKGKKLGSGLTTDSSGNIKFKYHHAKTFDTLDVTNVVTWEQAKNMAAAFEVAELQSADGTSYAQFVVNSAINKALVKWFATWINSEGSA